jgi:hypothetical protein
MDHHIRYTKDKGYGEDLYFHVVAFSKAQKIYVIHERLYVYRRDTPGSLSVNNDWRSRIISTLNYAYKAYDAIRMDNSNVSKHYQIFFKFFFETNMGGLLPDVQKQPWFSEVYEQFNSFYEDINRQTEAALLKHP